MTVQLWPSVSMPQLFVCANGPVAPAEVNVRLPAPTLVRVTGRAGVVVCIDCPPKSRLVTLTAGVGVAAWMTKVAVTLTLVEVAGRHVLVPPQPPPLQPVKTEPDAAVAVRSTGVPAGNSALQVAPQSMPVGDETTVPVPLPGL